MFRLYKDPVTQAITTICRVEDWTFIPFDPANTDYQRFKTDVLGGAELQDADGVTMSQAEAQAFIQTLP